MRNTSVEGRVQLSTHEPGAAALGIIFLKITLQFAFMGIVLLGAAGNYHWIRLWIYLALAFACFGVNASVVVHKNPQMVMERHGKHADTKPIDRILTAAIAAVTMMIWIVAGLDAGRFGWSSLPVGSLPAGMVLHVLGMAVIGWTLVTNPFAERSVRIQSDRGQEVVTDGPYLIVRHPMYSAMMVLGAACPLILGSAWGLAVLPLYALLFVLRTVFEDRTLSRELPGYAEYARHTRYRLVPGIW